MNTGFDKEAAVTRPLTSFAVTSLSPVWTDIANTGCS